MFLYHLIISSNIIKVVNMSIKLHLERKLIVYYENYLITKIQLVFHVCIAYVRINILIITVFSQHFSPLNYCTRSRS